MIEAAICIVAWLLIGGMLLCFVISMVGDTVREKRQRVRRHCEGIAERADQQHNWVMSGDPRGTYGPDHKPLEEPNEFTTFEELWQTVLRRHRL